KACPEPLELSRLRRLCLLPQDSSFIAARPLAVALLSPAVKRLCDPWASLRTELYKVVLQWSRKPATTTGRRTVQADLSGL
ncbi:hypothetical protein V5799_022374, partial [Amblyomma americanum]